MSQGRKPKPTALKVLAGNPGKRPLPPNEPQPRPGLPACPDWMGADGRLMWGRVVPELERLGVLTSVDVGVVETYCSLYDEFVSGQRRGEPTKSTVVNALRMHAVELGLTPASRSKISVSTGANDDPAEEFFRPALVR